MSTFCILTALLYIGWLGLLAVITSWGSNTQWAVLMKQVYELQDLMHVHVIRWVLRSITEIPSFPNIEETKYFQNIQVYIWIKLKGAKRYLQKYRRQHITKVTRTAVCAVYCKLVVLGCVIFALATAAQLAEELVGQLLTDICPDHYRVTSLLAVTPGMTEQSRHKEILNRASLRACKISM